MAKTIVWIEDHSEILEPVVRPLRLAGYRIELLRSVREALEALDLIRKADLVLLDVFVPTGPRQQDALDDILERIGQDFHAGRALLRLWRKTSKYAINAPVIVFTVTTDEEVVKDLVENLDAEVLAKPVRPSILKERVEHALDAHGAAREDAGEPMDDAADD